MKRLLDDVMVDEPTVVALAVKLFGKTHMDFTDCLLAARTAIYNDDVVSFGKPIIQGVIDYRRQRQTAADARSRSTDARGHGTDSTIDKLRHLFAEQFGNLGIGGFGDFDGVVQQGCHDGGIVKLLFVARNRLLVWQERGLI